MEKRDFDRAEREVLAVLPGSVGDLARLRVLVQDRPLPTVTVTGKYNHGKSRLLNELLGHDVFSVADRRETVRLIEHVHSGVRWLDCPGLDGDVVMADDAHAHHAAWAEADIRLFVHAAREGELDASERALLKEFQEDGHRSGRVTLFVLTQVDQMADESSLNEVVSALIDQASGWSLHPVSSTRHRQGIERDSRLLVERSGLPDLQAVLSAAIVGVPGARRQEKEKLLGDLATRLDGERDKVQMHLEALKATLEQQRRAFGRDLVEVLDKVQDELRPVLEVDGVDEALVPDSFENAFRMTAGKRERARIQIAYSRACIAIDACLVKHGVVGLPAAQRTAVSSLDTVMVAVMGVSVKYRADLRELFFEAAGRARLVRDFSRHFEQSEERQALALAMDDARASLLSVQRARQAVCGLEVA